MASPEAQSKLAHPFFQLFYSQIWGCSNKKRQARGDLEKRQATLRPNYKSSPASLPYHGLYARALFIVGSSFVIESTGGTQKG